MANQPEKRGIKNSWSLLAFARIHGPRMRVAPFKTVDKETGEERNFKSCVFTDPKGSQCFVSFSSKLGELTPEQIAEQQDDLQVAELNPRPGEENNPHYSLCRAGENSWKDVALRL